MPSRRTLLKAGGLIALGAVAGRTFAYPDVELEYGVGTLHPASDRVLAADALGDGAHPAAFVRGDGTYLSGPDASEPVRRALSESDTVRIVSRHRSTPDNPEGLFFRRVTWDGVWTLAVDADVRPWSALDNVDGERGERLRSADELQYTTVWTLSTGLSGLPDPGVRVETR